ncbi:MAG: S8 family serine peptidase [Calditrichaeota bacterium]|nr:S8 family serine peptidase [Calditrichota bacterium]MCB9368486.1 S8 family serine peptidase [Calditrichota bacterium]
MSALFALLLSLFTVSVALADYSPDVLFVKTRGQVRVSTLDGMLQTSSPALNDLLAANASGTLPFSVYSTLARSLNRVVELQLPQGSDLQKIAAALRSDSEIEWVAFNNRYSTVQSLDDPYVPNDEGWSDAWWLRRISADLAWEITRGDPSVLIGIIDTGVDHTHRDLRDNIWHNPGEIPDNGVDDDQNGFIDDVIGWDFVDAPSLPAGGDYLERDNDPMDDFGHGTYVSGCAAATSDNGICYPSIGFNCKLMPLRAGNANGTLEEDDVAAALLYGAANGAAVINMSFGDVVASPLLREVVQIAHQAGVVLVASAGNANNDGIHYPSGFAEVISVGATDSLDFRASFSNLGPSVDVMAPGVNILSTILGGECGEWVYPSGTSYAAPMVAGLAGLILSVNRDLTPDQVLDVIRSSADDIRTPGWDPETSNGRINARRAVEVAAFGADVEARISSPGVDSGVRGIFAVIGTARGTAYDSYELSYGLGENPRTWSPISTSSRVVLDDTLGQIEAPASDSVLVIRLVVHGTNQSQSVDMSHVYVQNGSPVIDSLYVRTVLDGPGYGQQITAWSNQICRASLLMTNSSGDSIREDFGYVNYEHVAVISQSRYQGDWQAVLQLTNLIGESVRSESFDYSSSQSTILPYLFYPNNTTLPHGILGNFVSDYDCDGREEVWLLPVDEFNIVDTLEPYEWNGADFVETENTYGPHIPQCYGDANGNGLMEMGARRFLESRIWEQSEACGVHNNIVFESPDLFPEFLISRYVTVDSTTGRQDILARAKFGSSSRLALFEVDPQFTLTIRDTLPNLTAGSNTMGPPGAAVGDIDRDGKLDIFYGDYDGDVIWCEWTGSELSQVWSYRMPQNDATTWMARGDIDCDGEQELVAGCRSNAGASSESQRLKLGWDYFIFESDGDNSLAVVDSIAILGNENVTLNPASVNIADVNADGCGELLISAFPDLYVFSKDETSGRYLPNWYYFPSKAGALVAYDFNGNGINEFLMSDGSRHLRIENAIAASDAPFPPVLSGNPLNETSVVLTWSVVPGAMHYDLYLTETGNQTLLQTTADTSYVWTEAPLDVEKHFIVVSYDTTFVQPYSAPSNEIALTANTPPITEDTAQVVAPKAIAVDFSEPMGPSAFVQGNWRLGDGSMPAVIAESRGSRQFQLVFDDPFAPGTYDLMLRNLRDAQGTPLPSSEQLVHFVVESSPDREVYIASHTLVDAPVGHILQIEYSEPMQDAAASAASYQTLDPRRGALPSQVALVGFVDDAHKIVEIELDSRYPVGAVGVEVRIEISELTAQSGNPFAASSLLISESAQNIDDAYVYPNPFKGRGAAGGNGVYFAALPTTATIRIFSIDGALLRKIEHNGATGFAEWDLRNDSGDAVSSGVYIYTIESNGDKVAGKIAVAR